MGPSEFAADGHWLQRYALAASNTTIGMQLAVWKENMRGDRPHLWKLTKKPNTDKKKKLTEKPNTDRNHQRNANV